MAANNGRYGPYLTKTGADGKSETRSLASEDEIFTVDIDKAKELFSQPKYGRGRGRGAAKPPLRDLGKDPNTGKNVTIKDGRFGAYITDGETNRTVPRQYTPESITPDDAFRLLAEKRAAGPLHPWPSRCWACWWRQGRCRQGQEGWYLAAVSVQEPSAPNAVPKSRSWRTRAGPTSASPKNSVPPPPPSRRMSTG